VSGGVASAIKNTIAELDPAREVPILKADSLAECKKLLALAKAGKAKGHLIEGMACPSGCVGGPGTLMPIARAGQAVSKFAQESPFGTALDNDTVLPER
jgi:iron only hydrogenase large subunit-like protein